MKKYISYIITAVIAGIFLSSCSEDSMDRINKNENDPADVASKLIITDMMISSAFNVTGSDFAFYASSYIEHNVGIYNQLYNAEIRSGEPTSSTTYNNPWNSSYRNLYNLKIIIDKCSEGGSEEGNYHTLGIAQILSAYNLAILTDLMGDIPWTEALQPGVVFTPKIDSQESIYAAVFQFLDDAIANLGKDTSYASLGTQDLFYGGKISKWIKFAYGLKARYTMRLSLKNPNYNDVVTFAEKSFESAAEQCVFTYNGSSSKSPFYSFYTDRDYFGASQSLHNKLIARNDPRDAVYFKPAKGKTTIEFAPNGTADQAQGKYGISALSTEKAPTFLMSYHELRFLKAEAYARLGDLTKAKEETKKAIIAACGKENVNVSETDATHYYTSNIESKLSTKDSAIKEIMVQKYIAFFEEEAVEAYNDVRRLKAMDNGNNAIKLDNPLNFPLRYAYGSKDVTTNANVRNAYGDGSYVYTEHVWWAGGSR